MANSGSYVFEKENLPTDFEEFALIVINEAVQQFNDVNNIETFITMRLNEYVLLFK